MVLLQRIMIRAICREQNLCADFVVLLKLALYIYPIVDVLSDREGQNDIGGMQPSSSSTQIIMMITIYSNTLFVCSLRRAGGGYRNAMLCQT